MAKSSTAVRLRNYAEALAENFALDTTLGDLLRILRGRPDAEKSAKRDPEVAPPNPDERGAASPGDDDGGSRQESDRGAGHPPSEPLAPVAVAEGGFSPNTDPVLRTCAPFALALEAPSSKPKADLRHKPVIEMFVRLWKERRGGEYRVIGARDGKALKSLLSSIPGVALPEIERRMRNAFADPWFLSHGHIAFFCSRWSNYDRGIPTSMQAPSMTPVPGKGGRVIGMRDGKMIYG